MSRTEEKNRGVRYEKPEILDLGMAVVIYGDACAPGNNASNSCEMNGDSAGEYCTFYGNSPYNPT